MKKLQEHSKFNKGKRNINSKKKSRNVSESNESSDTEDDFDLESDEEEPAKELSSGSKKFNKEKYLDNLKSKEPAFYKMLIKSKELLNAGSSDEEESCDENESQMESSQNDLDDEEIDDDDDEHVETEEIEGNRKPKKIIVVDKLLIQSWHEGIQKDGKFMKTFRSVEQGLHSALVSILAAKDSKNKSLKLETPKNFDDIIKFCLSHVGPALHRYFKIKSSSDKPLKSRRCRTINTALRRYLKDIILLSRAMVEVSAKEAILKKAIIPLVPFYCDTPKIELTLVKHLSDIWGMSEEQLQTLAFLALFRLCKGSDDIMFDRILKILYTFYVTNSRFTSPTTLDAITFMRSSLVELYCLDHGVAYKLAFTYIKSMAMHLRNASIACKQDKTQIVYNWQFVHSIHFVAELLSKSHPSPVLQPLIYPLTQVAIGTINLQRAPRYFPLVFHISSILTELSKHTAVFIPVLPPLLEILQRRPLKPTSYKASYPLDWRCILKVSVSQMAESRFNEGIIEHLYICFLNYFNVECSNIGFPELVFPAVCQIKKFLKTCKDSNHSKKMKQLLAKINENADSIRDKRKDVTFAVSDSKAVKDWEICMRQAGLPLHTYYESWLKLQESIKEPIEDKTAIRKVHRFRRLPKSGFKPQELQREEESDEDDTLEAEDSTDVFEKYVPSEDEDDSPSKTINGDSKRLGKSAKRKSADGPAQPPKKWRRAKNPNPNKKKAKKSFF